MADHAKLAPSSAYRWMNCPGSIGLSETVPPDHSDNSAADRGTDAHAIAERTINKLLAEFEKISMLRVCREGAYIKKRLIKKRLKETLEELKGELITDFKEEDLEYLIDYVRYIVFDGRIEKYIEQRLDLSCIYEGTFGTADAILVSEDDSIEIVDLKFGRVGVDAEKNPQLMIYMIGALIDLLKITSIDDIKDKDLILTIFQPFHKNTQYTVDHVDLWAFYQDVKRAAIEANSTDPSFRSGDHCKYCPALAYCNTAASMFFDSVDVDYKQSSIEDVAAIYEKKQTLKNMIDACERRLLDELHVGSEVGNIYVTTKLSRAKWRPGAIEELRELLGDRAEVISPITITNAKKLLDNKQIEKLLEERKQQKTINIITK